MNQPNENCNPSPPCEPCPGPVLEVWKEDFYQNRSTWLTKKEGLPLITNPDLYEEEEAAISRLRLEMNKDGGNILRNYVQDTTAIEVDSILVWLALLETYATDYRLARHYFFIENYTAFDALWPQIETKYDLDPFTELEYRRLDTVFTLIRQELLTAGDLSRLSSKAKDQLQITGKTCDEAGYLCQAILWRNGIDFEPECDLIEERGEQHPVADYPVTSATLRAYPNPVSYILTVEYAKNIQHIGQLRVVDLYGRVVQSMPLPAFSNTTNLNIDSFSPGIYFIEIQWAANAVERVKIVITH